MNDMADLSESPRCRDSVNGGASALLTDLYQLTMMGGYHAHGRAGQKVAFDLFYRRNPFSGGYCIAAGMADAVDFVTSARFSRDDISYLGSLGLFSTGFLDYLRNFRFTGDLWAVPEGTVVFPNEPILRVEATICEAQLLETALLNKVNFQTLIATKASRVCQAAEKGSVIEFGLRRAQGVDGSISATRACYIGGCLGTSNVLAGKVHGIPVKGTHSHAWVMSFSDELDAFRAYAASYPAGTILLVDTYNTLSSGVPNAIRTGLEMKSSGKRLLGIRIDSGDLAYLSIRACLMLDEAGLDEVAIVLSNDLDEWVISEIINEIHRECRSSGHDPSRITSRLMYGVGTSMVTGKPDAALGGVFKLVSAEENGRMVPRLKISDNTSKITTPGIKKILRLYRDGMMTGDLICLKGEKTTDLNGVRAYHPDFQYKNVLLTGIDETREILVRYVRRGSPAATFPTLREMQSNASREIASLDPTSRRLLNPHSYKVSLTRKLFSLKQRLLREHSS